MNLEDLAEEDRAIVIEEELQKVREMRNQKLLESDLYVMKKYENGETIGDDIRIYRQKLRDITTDFENPFDVIWPVDPVSGD